MLLKAGVGDSTFFPTNFPFSTRHGPNLPGSYRTRSWCAGDTTGSLQVLFHQHLKNAKTESRIRDQ